MDPLIESTLFILSVCAIYFFSRSLVGNYARRLYQLTRSRKITLWMVSLIYLPGTIVHELSHFFAALILFVRVHDVRIFPDFNKQGHFRLGAVLYEKTDVFRSALIGIAPFFGAMVTIWFMGVNGLFTHPSIWVSGISYICAFQISSSMFSSEEDLKDVFIVLPIFIIIVFLLYIFNIFPQEEQLMKVRVYIRPFWYSVAPIFLYSAFVHGILWGGMQLLSLKTKHVR